MITLDALTLHDGPLVGGKALSCARLLQAGFPVPPGLVVTADAADRDVASLGSHAWFDRFPVDQRFAVRSSGIDEDGADHSFAGIHDTLLNVARDAVPAAVRDCRRSTLSAQARAYRASKGLAGDARTGVLIQPMVAAVVSGVAFTVHPVTGADELLVNAAAGLGEALVSGLVEPDEFRVSKADRSLLALRPSSHRTPADPPLLTPDQLAELADCLLRIEAFYGAPQDVEWCRDAARLWIVQSRPVTTRARPAIDIEWTRANLAEVFPDQMSPQAVDGYEAMLNGGQRRFMGGLLAPESEYGPAFKAFGGRLYLNLTQLRHAAAIGGAPPAGVMRSLGHADAILPADERGTRPRIGTILRLLPDLVRLALLDARAPRLVRAQAALNDADVAAFTRVDPRTLDDAALWDRLDRWRLTGPDRMQIILVLGSVLFIEETLRAAARRVGMTYEELVLPQLAAGDVSVSTAQAFDLVDLAALARDTPSTAWYFVGAPGGFRDFRRALADGPFLAAFDGFLDRYGHRGHYESDWALPRYREDPTPLLHAIRSHVMHPPADGRAAIGARLSAEAARAWARFEGRLTWWQRLTLKPRVRATIRRLKQRYILREFCRSDLTRVVYHARQWQLALADRFVERGFIASRDDYFLLHTREIDAVVRGREPGASLLSIAAARRRELNAQRALKMPLLMRESEAAAVLAGVRAGASADPAASGDRFEGLCVSRGATEGEVVVIRDPRDFQSMRKGAILVAPATDPSWTPLFTLATGVIVEVGGILSHASTVAREYGLPALANVKDATTRLKTGDRLRLDASSGYAVRLQLVHTDARPAVLADGEADRRPHIAGILPASPAD